MPAVVCKTMQLQPIINDSRLKAILEKVQQGNG